MDDIYVIELHTDGDYGFPRDRVVEIGICRTHNGIVESVFSTKIKRHNNSFMKAQKDYLLRTSGINPEDLESGMDEYEAVVLIKKLLTGKTVTSFDIGFVFSKFLLFDPWDVTHEMDVMSSASMGLHPSLLEGTDMPSIISKAYFTMFPDDEKGIGEGRTALDLALMTSFIMLSIRE